MAWEVVIAGGGFGGFYAARELERLLPRHSARVTLVNDVNYMLYTPLLPGAAAGTLEPRHVVVPLREELRRTDLRLGEVTGADPDAGTVRVTAMDGRALELRYDHLIVALGSVSRTMNIPGLAEHAIGFKTLSQALELRNRLLQSFEAAEATENPEERAALLTFVFVGAGYAGLEGLAELQDFAADAIDLYPRCRVQGMRWLLVEGGPRVMGEIQPSLAAFAERELMSRGIEIRCNTTVDRVEAAAVHLSSGERVPCRTVAWTAGVKANPAAASLGLPLDDRGRIKADAYLQVEGRANVWALGDVAAVPDPAKRGQACPPTAQHALRQGRVVARNVAAALGTGSRRPFRYKTLGAFVDMGRHQAVASTAGIRWRGFPAWFLARSYHMAAMPGMTRRLRLVSDWTVDLLFKRDASELGHLGHPESLDSGALEAQTSGGTVPGAGGAPAAP
ncbi:MAG: NAD(P)/FAD-dependent oxidoreductase [Solirubrobacteraceae bacterium]